MLRLEIQCICSRPLLLLCFVMIMQHKKEVICPCGMNMFCQGPSSHTCKARSEISRQCLCQYENTVSDDQVLCL